MKKILFVINSLTIGGSEKSLISLLDNIDYSKYQVDLLMFKKGEELDKYIPKEVNIIEELEYYKFLHKTNGKYSRLKKIRFIYYKIKTSIFLRINSMRNNKIQSEQVIYKSQKNILKMNKKEYDVAIAYSQGMPTYFVADKVSANKKVAWINCDYATTMYDKDFDERFYDKFDNIVAVSETISKSILDIKPQYRSKIAVILDIVDPKLIESLSNEEIVFEDKSYTNILTVARLVIQHKGYDLAVKAAALLKRDNYKFKWFVVGDGQDREKLEKLIEEYGVKDCFILLGKKENPYTYMKNCDIYVQPSYKEGFGLTVIEAKILKKPIVCTNFNTARELINNGEDGLIIEKNENELYLGIKKYIDDKKFIGDIIENLKKKDQYNSIDEINKFCDLIN